MPGIVQFLMECEADLDRFIAEYVLDAIDRAKEIDGCEGISFDRDEQLNPDGDSVILNVVGDFEEFAEHERELWEKHCESGLVEHWEASAIDEEDLGWKFGERGADLAKRLLPLGGKMAKLAYEEFDGEPFPAPVNAYPDDDGCYPAGWYLALHHLTVGNLGYSPSEEIEMCLAAIDEDLRIIAERNGVDEVDNKIDVLIDTLDGMREDVKNGRPRPEDSNLN